MEDGTNMSISDTSQKIINSFKKLEDGHLQHYTKAIGDSYGRFKLWAGNIGALHRGQSSLDSRLGDSKVAQDFRFLLEELTESLEYLLNPFEHEQEQDDDEFSGDVLEDTIEAMSITITNLLKTSALVRHNPNRDPWKRILALPAWYSRPMTENAIQKWPKLGQNPPLAEKVGLANARRRQFFQYREEHIEKLRKPLQDDDGTLPDTLPTTFAGKARVTFQPQANASDEATSDTTFATTFGADLESKTTIPPPPNRHQFEDVECTLCRNIVSVPTLRSWKNHVYRDLRPYICTFKQCDLKIFDKRRDWQTHDIHEHRCVLACPICSIEKTGKLALQSHLQHAHAQQYDMNQLRSLASAVPVARPVLTSALCSFCDEWNHDLTRTMRAVPNSEGKFFQNSPIVTEKQFAKHVGKHMEQLSLFALPNNYEEGISASECTSNAASSDILQRRQDIELMSKADSAEEASAEVQTNDNSVADWLDNEDDEQAFEDLVLSGQKQGDTGLPIEKTEYNAFYDGGASRPIMQPITSRPSLKVEQAERERQGSESEPRFKDQQERKEDVQKRTEHIEEELRTSPKAGKFSELTDEEIMDWWRQRSERQKEERDRFLAEERERILAEAKREEEEWEMRKKYEAYERLRAKKQKEGEEKIEKEKEAYDEEYLEELQKDFAKFGMTHGQVKEMIDYDEETKKEKSYKEKQKVPVFPKIHKDDIEIDTLKHHNLEYDPYWENPVLKEQLVKNSENLIRLARKLRREGKAIIDKEQ